MAITNILITGLPKSGKSTLLKDIIDGQPNATGMYTLEVREAGTRTGFLMQTNSITKFQPTDLLYIDEIGEMELFSEPFKKLVTTYLDAPNTCIATISKVYSHEFIEKLLSRNDSILFEITPENREEKKEIIGALIKKIEKAKRYAEEKDRIKYNGDTLTIESDHGLRTVKKHGTTFYCDCDFFSRANMCSHVLAVKNIQQI